MTKKSEKDLLMMISELHKKIAKVDLKIDKSDANIKICDENLFNLNNGFEGLRVFVIEIDEALTVLRSRAMVKELYNIYIPNKIIDNNILYLLKTVTMDEKNTGENLFHAINNEPIMLGTVFTYVNEKKEHIKKTARDFQGEKYE